MNDFTKEELIEIAEYCNWASDDTGHSDFRRNLRVKIETMIDNSTSFNANKIAKLHLEEASSLIEHAMNLLRMKDE